MSIQLRNFTEKETYKVGYFFYCPLYHRQHPRKIKGAAVSLMRAVFYYVVGFMQLCCVQTLRLRNQIPNPYKIAFNSFTVLVRISSSVALQSSSRRWSSESAVDTEWRRLSTRRSSVDTLSAFAMSTMVSRLGTFFPDSMRLMCSRERLTLVMTGI